MSVRPFDLEAHLRARGLFDGDGFRRLVRGRHCRRCALAVLAGLDADRAALSAVVDPYLLDASGELAALLTGRRTYRLINVGDGFELDHRDQFAIPAEPPGAIDIRGRPVLVLAEHRCGARLSITPLQLAPIAITHAEEPTF